MSCWVTAGGDFEYARDWACTTKYRQSVRGIEFVPPRNSVSPGTDFPAAELDFRLLKTKTVFPQNPPPEPNNYSYTLIFPRFHSGALRRQTDLWITSKMGRKSLSHWHKLRPLRPQISMVETVIQGLNYGKI